MKVDRRHFLKTAGAVTLGFTGLQSFLRGDWVSAASAAPEDMAAGFGPLKPDPEGILDLPEGFTYKIISRGGDQMADGFIVPGRADGMAAFPGPAGKTILVRNHELNLDDTQIGPFGRELELLEKLAKEKIYDFSAGKGKAVGGTTNILYDTEKQVIEKVELSLVGTIRNCAGGPTPWNSWITCEETVVRAQGDLEQDHGYNFEVPAKMGHLAAPKPIKAMGRFNHEAVAVDPNSGIVFQTEDDREGLLYRYIPNKPGDLHAGGKLQALKVKDAPSLDTRNWDEAKVLPGKTHDVEWIDMDEVESPKNDLRYRGFEAGAARFARAEGMWYGNDAVYFACTNGGKEKKGQIWRYVPSAEEGKAGEANAPGKLELFVEPNDGALIDNADNLTVSPFGDLIVCEDGSGKQFLVGITPKGEIYKFARNVKSSSEMAGAAFSPDGSTLFVNIQHDHLTLAITGPWRKA